MRLWHDLSIRRSALRPTLAEVALKQKKQQLV
jgi:hypothetical protein